MRNRIAVLAALSVLGTAALANEKPAAEGAAPGLWTMDLDAARKVAAEKKLPLLLNFTGSDWCGWCKRLDAEVFSTDAFREYAAANLVAVLADFPRRTKLAPELQVRNERLMRHFQVQGFPTVLLFNPGGELIAELGYQPGGPEAFVAAIQQARSRYPLRRPDLPPGPMLPLE